MTNPKDTRHKDFNDFVNSSNSSPTPEMNEQILNFVSNDLNPGHAMVLGKLSIIQAFIGIITMTFCPQFDMSLTNNYDLFHFFHHTFGEIACMAICGSIFMGSGAIFASYLLKSSEIQKIKSSSFLYYLSMTAFAMGIFFILGAEFYLTLSAAWFVGASLGGIFLFQVNQLLRQSFS